MAKTTLEILDASGVEQEIARLAAAIVDAHSDLSRVVLVGIRTRGVPLAFRLADQMGHISASQPKPTVAALDITFFRDDLQRLGLRTPDQSDMPRDLTDLTVILVDDVLFRGRTIRAALEALHHFGRPQVVRLAVLIDRLGYREFPIQPDYTGLGMQTRDSDVVRVHLVEKDGEDRVFVEQGL